MEPLPVRPGKLNPLPVPLTKSESSLRRPPAMPSPLDRDVKLVLKAIRTPDDAAPVVLAHFLRLHQELRNIAQALMRKERPDHTLQTTALVSELYLKLAKEPMEYRSEKEWLAYAARAMKNILIDHAKKRVAAKRGGDRKRVPLDSGVRGGVVDPAQTIQDLHDLLEALAMESPRTSEVVRLRFLGGLTVVEIAAALKIAPATVEREQRLALAWLRAAVSR